MKKTVLLCCFWFVINMASAEEMKLKEEPGTPQATAAAQAGTVQKVKYSRALAQELLAASDDSMYPEYFKSTFTMVTHRKNKKDLTYSYLMYGKGSNQALMEITEPAREKGKKILLNKDNLWMYIPSVSRPIRLSRKQSFMGSAFSNEDLMNSTMADDYDPEILDKKGDLYLLGLKAKRRDVAYARIEMWIYEKTKIPTEATYYGLSGKAIKKMEFTEVKELADKLRPSKMLMIDLLEEGASTEVLMDTLVALKSVPDYMFDQTQLGR
ncbi:outer membrane lipoprotein-sorting protein [candidate division FCPU426 bacterium]|nr:outer membrane lipoprotein-sorting protein [candidate division FCPU426 bacterium]